ncbi:MAG: ribbon-helix-helix protein, CopG family [Chloroflexota bacterium]
MSQGYKYRAQILLEPEQHRQLAEIAKRENRSVSDVVREAVAEYVTAQTQDSVLERRMKALETIREHRQAILRERGGKPIEIDMVELIHQMREERDSELLAAIESLQEHRR